MFSYSCFHQHAFGSQVIDETVEPIFVEIVHVSESLCTSKVLLCAFDGFYGSWCPLVECDALLNVSVEIEIGTVSVVHGLCIMVSSQNYMLFSLICHNFVNSNNRI